MSSKEYGIIGVGPSLQQSFFDQYPNCTVCSKTCYTAEQILVGERCFHFNDDCWSCGVLSDPPQGCGKRLDRNPNQFALQLGLPYCLICFDSLFLEGYGTKANVLERPSESKEGTEDEPLPNVQKEIGAHSSAVFRMSAPADDDDDAPLPTTSSASASVFSPLGSSKSKTPESKFALLGQHEADRKCPACKKTVYKMEEHTFEGVIWHKLCFTCGGGASELGCKRVLANGVEYKAQAGVAFCNACFSRHFMIAGARGAMLITASGAIESSKAASSGGLGSSSGDAEVADATSGMTLAERSAAFRMSGSSGKETSPPTRRDSKLVNLGSALDASKCPACKKTVYKMEEHAFEGVIWHKLCFTCGGGASELGCKRVLANGVEYKAQAGVAFCNACFSRHFMIAGARGAMLVTASGAIEARPSGGLGSSSGDAQVDVSGMTLAERSAAFRTSSGSGKDDDFAAPSRRPSEKLVNLGSALDAVKCPGCSKTVYKMEELKFEGAAWHKLCFTCGGGVSELGCKRVLAHGDYKAQAGVAFCNACFSRHFMTAGARGAMLITASGAIEAVEKSASTEDATSN